MKKTALLIACAGLIVGGMGLAAPAPADAGFNLSIGTGNYGFNSGYGYNRGYNRGYNNYNNYNRTAYLGNNWNHGYVPNRIGYGCQPAVIAPRVNYRNVAPVYRGSHFGNRGFRH